MMITQGAFEEIPGTYMNSEEASLIDPNQIAFFNNDFVGRNRDIVEKFKKYDNEKRMVFSRLRDELTSLAG